MIDTLDSPNSIVPLTPNTAKSAKIIVGLSGGVDSSVAAYLLLQQGYTVEGLFMKNWEEDDETEYCTAKEDLESASEAAKLLGIPLHTANFAAEYWDNVFEYFLAEYRNYRVPNPDVLCNKEIKFDAFLNYAKSLGANQIATGHYVRKQHTTTLHKGMDTDKDQSYFLHALNPAQLADCLFPIGNLTKADVREIAKKIGLPNHDRKDSTGVCFIGERHFKSFLSKYLQPNPGPIVTIDNQVVGEHSGLLFYTLGQRRGLGIGGQQNQKEAAWYVAEKRVADNTLVVVQDPNHPLLLTSQITATDPHWIQPLETLNLNWGSSKHSFHCEAKLRHRQKDQPCQVKINPNDTLTVEFASPQRAVNPGQYVVFYAGSLCLGGATIH